MLGHVVIAALAAFNVAVSVLPLIRTDLGWVRVWDFPRLQILVLALTTGTLALLMWRQAVGGQIAIFAMLAVAAYQFVRIWQFTPVASVEVVDRNKAGLVAAADCLCLLSVNVKMENRRFDKLEAVVRRIDPDIALILEPDAWWGERLDELFSGYRHRIYEALDNRYGLIFYTRLEAEALELRYLVEDDIPSVFATLRLPSGRTFDFYGIHPRPPLPTQDTAERDGELIVVGKAIAKRNVPAVVSGDLNDVGWSHTSRLFRRIARMLDPRVGRGFYATFHADYWFARYPLDHLFVTRHFALEELTVLPHIGSDHFPICGRLCLGAVEAAQNEMPEAPDEEDREEAAETAREGHEAATDGGPRA